jgi:hypothetical protein
MAACSRGACARRENRARPEARALRLSAAERRRTVTLRTHLAAPARTALAVAIAVALGLALVLSSSVATAEEATAPPTPSPPGTDGFVERFHPGFGARIGGYDFRSTRTGVWNDCPMGGVGVFGTLDLTRHLFVEMGLDTYDSTPLLGSDEGMDRVSFLTSAAIGARMFPDFYVVPYVQIGAAMEWTRVEELGQKVEGLFPAAFLGIGGELNVFRHIKAGADLRFLGMAHPYEDATTQAAPGVATGTVRMEMQPAGQALFFARYVL